MVGIMARVFRNILGAFSDGAILFPLIGVLSKGSGYSTFTLFLTAGLFYIVSGLYFRVPMPIQPLKAIAIAAIVSGASFLEVRIAGALLGVLCLLLLVSPVIPLADKIPKFIVHGIQLSLGLMLIRKGVEELIPFFFSLTKINSIIIIAISGLFFLFRREKQISVLGITAGIGAILGFLTTENTPVIHSTLHFVVNWKTILLLVLPQLLLTSANSVIATQDVAKKYFKDQARRVTLKSLLCSIGIGNLCSALIGGLPFCHGSGGMTAHARGGSDHWLSNLVIGFFLLGLAATQFLGKRVEFNYPPFLLGVMLILGGIYHTQLASPSWKTPQYRPILIMIAIVSTTTNNLIYGLSAGILIAFLISSLSHKGVLHDSI